MKRRQLKKITTYIFGIALSITLLSSCSDFLEVAPKESVDESVAITDKNSLQTAVRGLYRAVGSNSYYGDGFVALGFVPSGDVEFNVNDNLSNFSFRADASEFVSVWASIFSTINIANHILLVTPTLTDVSLTDAERNKAIGEAHFVRALAYFDLARGWGGVPIKTKPTVNIKEEQKIKRSTREETYAFVLSELEEAEKYLSDDINRVRATKTAVWALKARLYLYTQKWDKAADYATKVINLSNAYKLSETFSGWFKNNVTQTQESILEIAYSAQNQNSLRARMSLLARGGSYRFRPADAVIATLRNPATGGSRVDLLDSVTQSGVKQYAGALYYRSPATDPAYVLRLAEQYLIRAEALAQQEILEEARLDINIIRSRANLQDIPTGKSKQELLDIILGERRLEFLWEAHRYFDLARTGKLQNEVAKLKPNVVVKPHFNLFPIPINEVELGQLEQNPNY